MKQSYTLIILLVSCLSLLGQNEKITIDTISKKLTVVENHFYGNETIDKKFTRIEEVKFHKDDTITIRDTTYEIEPLRILYAERRSLKNQLFFLPEIEHIFQSLEKDSTGQRFNVLAQYLRRLTDSKNIESDIEDETNNYVVLGTTDPNRDSKFLKILGPFLKDNDLFVEINFKKINEYKYYYEFLRYQIDHSDTIKIDTALYKKADEKVNTGKIKETKAIAEYIGKLEYINSSSTIIDLSKDGKKGINDLLKKAIIKIFPEFNQKPIVNLYTDRKSINEKFHFGIGDTIAIFSEIVDRDSPTEDFSFHWNQIRTNKNKEAIQLDQELSSQKFVATEKGKIEITLMVNDGISNSDTSRIIINVIPSPEMKTSFFDEKERKVLDIYYWDFNGIPQYYTLKSTAKFSVCLLDSTYYPKKDLNFLVELKDKAQLFPINSYPTNQEDTIPEENYSVTFNYTQGHDTITGGLVMPYRSVKPEFYNFKMYLEYLGVKSQKPEILVANLFKFRKFSMFWEGVGGLSDSGNRYFKTNLGIKYKSGRNFGFYFLPGAVISNDSNWGLNILTGINWIPLMECGGFWEVAGLDLGVNHYSKLFGKKSVQSLQSSAFWQPKLKYPLIQVRYSFFIEKLFTPPWNWIMGIKVGLTARDYTSKKGG